MSQATSFDPYALPHDALVEPPASLWQALKKIGPGIILAGSIIGSGELILTTSLGAQEGYICMWLILFSCVIKVFVQVELGRNAISSGMPTLGALDALPGPRFGAHWLVWWWLIMLLCTVSQLGAMAGGTGQALNIAFPKLSLTLIEWFQGIAPPIASAIESRPEKPWTILLGILAIVMLLSGGYKRVERITTLLVAGATLLTVTCVLALPATDYPIDAIEMVKGFKITLPSAGIALAFAVFGITGVGASELYSYPYWCLEKGYARWAGPQTPDDDWARRARGWIRVMNLDAWVSMLVFTVATVSFYLMGAAVLHPQKLDPKGADMIRTLSEMYIGPFGQWTQIVFLIGAGVVLFKTLYVSAASHSRLTSDFLSLAGFVQYPNAEKRARFIRGFCFFYPCFAVALYLFFGEPKAMVVFGGFFQALTLPVIAGATLYLRYFRTDRRLAPTITSDICLWTAFITIAAVACWAVPDTLRTKVIPLFRDMFGAA